MEPSLGIGGVETGAVKIRTVYCIHRRGGRAACGRIRTRRGRTKGNRGGGLELPGGENRWKVIFSPDSRLPTLKFRVPSLAERSGEEQCSQRRPSDCGVPCPVSPVSRATTSEGFGRQRVPVSGGKSRDTVVIPANGQEGQANMAQPTSSALRALALEYKSLQEEPVEGFRVKLVNEDNMFEWEVAIFGPPDTLYQGGYFKAHMKFPPDYPYSPPSIRFMTKVWHPNVYENGDLCISILHPPVDDPQSGELPCERWNPTQNVRTILLSVISLLNEPNTFSPANVDASVMYRRWRDSKGRDKEYENIIRKQAQAAKMEAEKEGIVVPVTLEDYCIKTNARPAEQQLDMTDFYDDEYELDDDEDDQLSASEYEDGDDSGNGES